MNILIANLSGNTGKTTLATHVLWPNIPGSKIVNSLEKISGPRNLIVDLDPANLMHLLERVEKSPSYLKDTFDLILVPTEADPKIMHDTAMTINLFAKYRFPANKIVPVFNRAKDDSEFKSLRKHQQEQRNFVWCKEAVLPEEPLFDEARPGRSHNSAYDQGTVFNKLKLVQKDLAPLCKALTAHA